MWFLGANEGVPGTSTCIASVGGMDILVSVRGEHGDAPSCFMTTPLDPWVHGSLCFLIFMAESFLSRWQVKYWFLSVAHTEHAYLNISPYLCPFCVLVYCFRLSYWTPRPWFCFSMICLSLTEGRWHVLSEHWKLFRARMSVWVYSIYFYVTIVFSQAKD